ncbi:hypothetical protein FH972_006767 [Carpinus fangiana]|uniref:non-specific serine/threonine protein kinase n=1 Tax=Carpinus fangiana TaxID=176857 RepID=A0A5N6QUC8_9ROSI|nr:hypothetical protein FH972_006767 [Carpinus fangiana]
MDISIFFLLLCLLQAPPLFSSKTFDILRGSSLSVEKPSDNLVSANGDFSAGFFSVGDNAFSFAIWFTKSSVPTIVWMANRDDPVDGRGSKLSLLRDGSLILTNSAGNTIWSTQASISLEASMLQLQLLHTGNLVLHNSDQSVVIWQSFDSPTDTLLPQQTLTRVSSLISKKSQADYSIGHYKLHFDDENVLRLLYQGPTVSSLYWPTPWVNDPGLLGRSKHNTSRDAVLNVSGNFQSSENCNRLPARDRLGCAWKLLSVPCQIHGICGPNSVCHYDHASGRRCGCLKGFKMKNLTDLSYGCEPEFSVSCNQTDGSSFVQLADVQFYGSDIEFMRTLNFQGCEERCLMRCDCKGFQFSFNPDEGVYHCFPKFMLLNGQRTPNFGGNFYLRLPRAVPFHTKTPDKESKLECSREVPMQVQTTYENEKTDKHSNPAEQRYLLTSRFRRFSFAELRKATKGFSEVIGRGAVGTVYKGVLPDQRVCAIKRLNEANQGEAEFLAEVNTIGRLNHMNLIDIWGFCAEGKHRLLVYEYMEHGSFAKNLSSNIALDWEKKFEIAVGTAKGLAYLHDECLEWVLHCVVKPENILLDSDYQPKVADFGLSKLLNRGELDHLSFSKMRGARGYMAPECAYNLPITSKVDVYSYGIVVLEMVTGKSPTIMHSFDSGGAREHTRLVTLVREQIGNIGNTANFTD